MSTHACCAVSARGEHDATRREKAGESSTALVRVGKLGSWIAPSAALVFLPKCPMCLAAYLALVGIGMSERAAGGLRLAIIVMCCAVIGYLAGKLIARAYQS
jgi:hypothetical protein